MMLTSSGQYGDSARCRELGVAAYLTKPITPSDLLQAIYGALERPGADVLAAPGHVPGRLLAQSSTCCSPRTIRSISGWPSACSPGAGTRVVVAKNGREAISALERETFDVVLMDVQMPEMGGFEATAAIRAREREKGGHVRIVAMTAHAMKGDRERCLAAGMDDYLAKPAESRALFAVIEKRLRAPSSSCQLRPCRRRPASTWRTSNAAWTATRRWCVRW